MLSLRPEGHRHTLITAANVYMDNKNRRRNLEKRGFTCAGGDDKLLQTHVNIQVFLEDRKLEGEDRRSRFAERRKPKLTLVNVRLETSTSYQGGERMGGKQLHHLGNNLQTLPQVPLPLCLLL